MKEKIRKLVSPLYNKVWHSPKGKNKERIRKACDDLPRNQRLMVVSVLLSAFVLVAFFVFGNACYKMGAGHARKSIEIEHIRQLELPTEKLPPMKMLDELRTRLTPKTPAERERLKRIAVYTVLCLSCLVCISLIFAPSGDDDAVKGKANTELPDGTTEGMPDTKIKAYEQAADAEQRASQQDNLVHLSESLDTIRQPQTDTVPDEIQTSAEAYQQARASLQDFYIPETSEADLQVAELQERIAELEMQQSQPDYGKSAPDEMELLERSYQLAAQYMGNGNAKGGNCPPPTQSEEKGKRNVQPVAEVNRNVVSSLSATSSRGFNTSVECEGSIYEVELQVYDSDGQEGINIPQSMESDALHEIGANMGSTMGSSINISTNTGAQIASDVGRGLINGVSQYLTKKLRTVKVHLKAGYRVMLHQPEDL